MGYLYQPKLKSGRRSSIWWAKYYVNGRPIRESTGIKKGVFADHSGSFPALRVNG